ncbi:MAG: hypothetical protein AAF251_02865 [Pseudomonadota bacterium]
MYTKGPSYAVLAATLGAALTLASPAFAGGINAGTLIENTATATYEEGGVSQTISSNTVVVRVDELLDVTVTSLDSGPIAVTPGEAILTFEVTNQGNGPEPFELLANTTVADNDFETVVQNIAIDTNGNGVYDPGVDEILTSPETTAILEVDEAVTVFVIVDVPDGVTDQQLSQVELTANAVTGNGTPGTIFAGQGEGGGDAVVGTTTASATASGTLRVAITTLDLTKSVALVDPFGGESAVPGSTATFTLTATISGSDQIEDLVVTDLIPDGTTYVPGSLTFDAAALTDASGDDAGEGSDEAGISVSIGTAPGGTTHIITFAVTID